MPDWSVVLTLLVTGFLLLLIEVLVIPGFGLPGIVGLGFLFGGAATAYTQLSPAAGICTALGSAAIIALGLRLIPRTQLWRRLRLDSTERRQDGYSSAPAELAALVGRTGRALTSLRPSGAALIDGHRVDVVTEGLFVAEQTEITVVRVDGGRVVVRSTGGSVNDAAR